MTRLTQEAATTREVLMGVLHCQQDVQAALLYGSVARGDSEPHSDLDLLVLCPSGKKRLVYDDLMASLSERFGRLSLSMYSEREIQFLAKAKSLFLLHLNRESDLLVDRTVWLTTLLRDFEPKETYEPDFRSSLALIEPLRTLVIGAPNQIHRLAYIYSLFRVYGVYLLARMKIFEFSKAKMSAALEVNYPEQHANIRFLSSLRVLSAEFFSNSGSSQVVTINLPDIASCLDALGAIVGTPIVKAERTYSEAVEEFLSAAMSQPFRLGYRLRTWFLLLVYDGLNLYYRKFTRQITSFNEQELLNLTHAEFPEEVRRAALLSIEYLRNYPLKYFLLEETKIGSNEACSTLFDLSSLVKKS